MLNISSTMPVILESGSSSREHPESDSAMSSRESSAGLDRLPRGSSDKIISSSPRSCMSGDGHPASESSSSSEISTTSRHSSNVTVFRRSRLPPPLRRGPCIRRETREERAGDAATILVCIEWPGEGNVDDVLRDAGGGTGGGDEVSTLYERLKGLLVTGSFSISPWNVLDCLRSRFNANGLSFSVSACSCIEEGRGRFSPDTLRDTEGNAVEPTLGVGI
jgi:hypothetical protein